MEEDDVKSYYTKTKRKERNLSRIARQKNTNARKNAHNPNPFPQLQINRQIDRQIKQQNNSGKSMTFY